ncbi:hypothetical protein [Paracoccus niistensis]|uniref:VCBS repeat-containing protein n=1 Tax=Paracoccus niistensis TaxID=632935 RepID=A0ABV6I8J4_9RHOB
MILMAYDNPGGPNNFRYRVGLNLDGNGVPASWLPQFITTDGVGWEGQGAGAALASLDGDSRPDLILMAYDAPSGANSFRYRIGWNLGANGQPQSWQPGFVQVDGVGWEGQGADVLITSLDANPRPEMILLAYDNPRGANNFRYRIGWNLGTNGIAASWQPGFFTTEGVGWEGQGAGASIAYLDNDPRPELVVMAYDAPPGANDFRYRVGFNLSDTGTVTAWQSGFTAVAGLGHEGQGAGMTFHNLDGDARPDMVLMAYDNPPGPNEFRYRVLNNRGLAQGLDLEMDRLSSVGWLPASATVNGITDDLPSMYRRMGIDARISQDRGDLRDLHPGTCYTDAELAGLLTAQMSQPPADPARWHMYGILVTCHVDGILGIMFDTLQRRGFAQFMNAFTEDGRRLRTAAHELGHAICLYHSDGDAWRIGGPVPGTGRTIMNQTAVLAPDWGYAWDSASLHLAYENSRARWRPVSGFGFNNCK